MCDEKLLTSLRQRQVKPTEVHCTQNSNCWCNELSFRFPMSQIQEKCFSPQELLENHKTELSPRDLAFLKALVPHKFVVD